MYLAWYDPDKKKSPHTKIAEAHARYVQKFGVEPAVCLVNPLDVIDTPLVEVRPLKTVGRDCFWIGGDDPTPAGGSEKVREIVAAAANDPDQTRTLRHALYDVAMGVGERGEAADSPDALDALAERFDLLHRGFKATLPARA